MIHATYTDSPLGQEEGHRQLLRIRRLRTMWATPGLVIAYSRYRSVCKIKQSISITKPT
jgi:hypothetical protein